MKYQRFGGATVLLAHSSACSKREYSNWGGWFYFASIGIAVKVVQHTAKQRFTVLHHQSLFTKVSQPTDNVVT